MLSKRIIPQLLCRGRQLIKGKQFKSWRSVGVAAQAVRVHQMRGVDELMLLDIGATAEGRGPDISLVEELSEVCFMPLTVGGGIRTVGDAKALLRAGADKIAIGAAGTLAIYHVADSLGAQAVVGIINYHDHAPHGIAALAHQYEQCGAGEILLQCIDREGIMEGYDIETLEEVTSAVSVPVIASGGCGSYEHMLEAIRAGADAVGVGSLFQFQDETPRGAAEYLHQRGVEVRL